MASVWPPDPSHHSHHLIVIWNSKQAPNQPRVPWAVFLGHDHPALWNAASRLRGPSQEKTQPLQAPAGAREVGQWANWPGDKGTYRGTQESGTPWPDEQQNVLGGPGGKRKPWAFSGPFPASPLSAPVPKGESAAGLEYKCPGRRAEAVSPHPALCHHSLLDTLVQKIFLIKKKIQLKVNVLEWEKSQLIVAMAGSL